MNLALVREFERIFNQVDQNLLQANVVADQTLRKVYLSCHVRLEEAALGFDLVKALE